MDDQLIKRFLWMTSYSKYLYKLNCSASSSHTIIQDTTPFTALVIKQILDLNICTIVTAIVTVSLRYKEGNRFNLACTAHQ